MQNLKLNIFYDLFKFRNKVFLVIKFVKLLFMEQ